MIECKAPTNGEQLSTRCISVLPSCSPSALHGVDLFLRIGNYDFHRMHRVNALRRQLVAFASVADHYRAATARGEQKR